MNYLVPLIVLLSITSVGHIHIFSKRFIRILVPLLVAAPPDSQMDTFEGCNLNKDHNLQALLTFVLLLMPLLLYKCLRNSPFDNIVMIYFSLSLLVIISIFGLWFSVIKLRVMNKHPSVLFRKTNTTIATEKTLKATHGKSSIAKKESKAKKINRKKKKEDIVLRSQFIEFLDVVAGYELYEKSKFHFNLGGYKILDKGRTITPAQACFILTFFLYHEVLKSNEYNEEVPDVIWQSWKSHLQIKAPLTKGNWKKFKDNYLHKRGAENKYLDLKESDFYISFKEYYTKK